MEYDYDPDLYAKPLEEMDYQEYYDGETDSDMEGGFTGDGFMAPFSLAYIYEHCLIPNMLDAFRHVGKLVLWCVMFRILTQAGNRATGGIGGMPLWTSHLASTAIGIVVLAHFFYSNTAYPIILTATSFIVLHLTHYLIGLYRGVSMAILCLSFNAFCELHLALPHDWQSIRGVQMVLSMKIISLGFDMDTFAQNQPTDTNEGEKELKENRGPGTLQYLRKVPTIFEYFG